MPFTRIGAFARAAGIATGIVVGRLQHGVHFHGPGQTTSNAGMALTWEGPGAWPSKNHVVEPDKASAKVTTWGSRAAAHGVCGEYLLPAWWCQRSGVRGWCQGRFGLCRTVAAIRS